MNDPLAHPAKAPDEQNGRIVIVRHSLNVVAGASAFCAYYDWAARRPLAIFLIVFPWAALLLGKFMRPISSPGQVWKSNTATPVLISGLALAYLALVDSASLGWTGSAILTIFGAGLLAMGIFFADPESKPHGRFLAILAVACCTYGYGAGLELNALFDKGSITSYPVHVISKRGPARAYAGYLTVEPWGPNESDNQITVRRSLYRQVSIGTVVCVNLHPGAFGVNWYAASMCP
jgi:hypothetical protein